MSGSATETATKIAARKADEEILHRHYMAFLDKWAPDGGRKRHEFDADLFSLVRAIQHDAAAPYVKMADAVLRAAVPLPLFTAAPIITPKE